MLASLCGALTRPLMATPRGSVEKYGCCSSFRGPMGISEYFPTIFFLFITGPCETVCPTSWLVWLGIGAPYM